MKYNIKESEIDQLKLKDNNRSIEINVINKLKTDKQNQINNSPLIINNQLNNQPQIQNNQKLDNTNQAIPQSNLIPVAPIIPLIAHNDIQGFVPIIKPKQFGSKPISTYCPNCRFPITTNSSRKCNCCSCCFCWFCFYFWIFLQCCRQKEITCYDYEHTCPRCGFVIGNYDAW